MIYKLQITRNAQKEMSLILKEDALKIKIKYSKSVRIQD